MQLSLIDRNGTPTMDAARHARDLGMGMALDHAEEMAPGWGDLAYHFLENFCRKNAHFISEDVSDASKLWGMTQPPTDRAWGAVYKRAAKAGIIEKAGSGTSRRRHASICPMWRSLIYKGAQ